MKNSILFLVPLTMMTNCRLIDTHKSIDDYVNDINQKVTKQYQLEQSKRQEVAEINSFYIKELQTLQSSTNHVTSYASVRAAWETELKSIVLQSSK